MDFRLAIIIPTYDSLDTLKTLLEGVYKHTDGDYRIYVIEDGQKKETIDYLKDLDAKVIYHEKNEGVAKSWNDGLKMAYSDGYTHFAVFNDDIELPSNWWKQCREFFTDKHLVFLTSALSPSPILFTGWFFILDRFCLKKIGYFDEQFTNFCSEDSDYFIRYQASCLKYGMIDLNVEHWGSKTLNKIKKKDLVYFKRVLNENWLRLRKKYPKMRMENNLIR